MTDVFSAVELGEATNVILQLTLKAQSKVTKGQVVQWNTHTTGEPASVEPATAASVIVAGVAMQTIEAGEWGPVLIKGAIKVTAGTGGCTLGKHVMVAPESGEVCDADAYDKVVGRAIQTIASGDTGLIILD